MCFWCRHFVTETAVGSQHKTAHLGAELHVAHARGDEDLLIDLAHALAYCQDVRVVSVRPVRDPHAAGEVYEAYVRSCLLVELHRQAEELHGEVG